MKLRSPRLGCGLPGRLLSGRLDNGLELHLLANADAPVVTVALTYRAGARDDPAGRAGLAHFLEHMMFKGSERFGPGDVDRLTRSLGGRNNAFTSHDSTTYYFSFAADAWARALEVEGDRMRGLRLDPVEIERERDVILEEIAMYEAEPWDALEKSVQRSFYGDHPYARPVIGTETEVRSTSAEDLALFHSRLYRPDNAVLVVAGAVGERDIETIERAFADTRREGSRRSVGEPSSPRSRRRIEIDQGRVARLLISLPIPSGEDLDFPALRLLGSVLALGRSSALNRRLVDDGGLCVWISAAAGESPLGGAFQIVAELVPGADPAEVENIVFEELARLRDGEIAGSELDRARRVLEADWIFGHERVESQAITLSLIASLFSPSYADRQLEAIAGLTAGDLRRAAARHLDPQSGSVVGWALPTEAGG